jgi:DNA-binding NarL/FixJ family response regulator
MQAPYADPFLQPIFKPSLPLLGRETELQIVHYLLDAIAYDLPRGARALTISGEIGVGKTRLLAQMCRDAQERGFLVLEGNAYEATSTFPYLPFIEALRPILRTSSSEQLAYYVGLTPSSARSSQNSSPTITVSLTGIPMVTALARFFPELPSLLNVEPKAELLTPDQEKFRLLDAVATLLERLATEQPILLCIDNLQWADSASLELTLYLTIRLRSSRIALVGVTRPTSLQRSAYTGEDALISATAAAAATRALTDLVRQGLLLLLPLSPLSQEAALQHLHALLPGTLPEDIPQALLTRAEGNPFFMEELVRSSTQQQLLTLHNGTWHMTQTMSAKLPESITEAIRQRLQSVSQPCLALLHIAALFGRTFPLDALLLATTRYLSNSYATSLRSTEAESVQALLDEALQASLITSIASNELDTLADLAQIATPRYTFCQGLVHEVLLADIAIQHLRMLHLALGRALEDCYAHEATKHAAELARHYTLAGDQAAALRWSLLAGEDAARQQAHREAIHHFRLALKLVESVPGVATTAAVDVTPAQLYLTIGELWFRLGELTPAITALQQAIECWQQPAPPLLLARINRSLADAYRMQAHYDQALTHLEATQQALQSEVSETSLQANLKPSWFPGRSFVTRSADTLKEQDRLERVQFLQAQGLVNVMLNRGEEAEQALWQSYQLATILGDLNSQAFALHFVAWIRGWGQHIHEAIRLLKQANELYIAIGDPFRAALGDQLLSTVYQAIGELEQAQSYTQRGFERANRYGVRRILGWLHFNQGVMALAQGKWSASQTHLQEAWQEAEVLQDTRLKPVVLQARAELHFRRGNWDQAEQLFHEAIQAAENTEWFPGTLALYGHFLAATGQHKAARTQLDRASATPEPIGFGGHYYIPFLAAGYALLEAPEQAATYTQRISNLHGFFYYGYAVDRILGEIAIAKGDWPTAEQALADALALCQRTQHHPEAATVLYTQARAAVMRGENIAQIQRLCEDARKAFVQYDMQRAVTLVDMLLEGVRVLEKQSKKVAASPKTAEYSLHLSLTGRELEVLRLVAEGYTDRDVADKLVISHRTANRHLSNIFVKLDVPSRAAAVAYAIRHGLV